MTVEAFFWNLPAYRGVEGEPDLKETTATFRARIRVGDERAGVAQHDIHIRRGYRFDGASIPRVLWRLCGHPFQSPRDAAALLHDWLYASKLHPRDVADAAYRAMQLSAGIPAWKANLEYWALRAFGGAAWRSHGADDARDAMDHAVVI